MKFKMTGGALMPLLYIAAPDSDSDPAVREQQLEQLRGFHDELLQLGIVFHEQTITMARDGNTSRRRRKLWAHHGREMLYRCDALVVYELPEWRRKKRLQRMINTARDLHKPIVHHDPETPVVGSLLEQVYGNMVSLAEQDEVKREQTYQQAKQVYQLKQDTIRNVKTIIAEEGYGPC